MGSFTQPKIHDFFNILFYWLTNARTTLGVQESQAIHTVLAAGAVLQKVTVTGPGQQAFTDHASADGFVATVNVRYRKGDKT